MRDRYHGGAMAMAMSAAAAVLALSGCRSAPPPKPPAPVDAAASATLSPPEQALRDRVRRLLAERMGEEAGRIQVHVEGTTLWLTGHASDRWERDRAHDLAHEVVGVTRVDSSGIGTE